MNAVRSCIRVAIIVGLLAGAALVVFAGGDRNLGSSAATADWWSRVQRQITDSEYHVTWQDRTYLDDLDAAWQAPNRAHGFRSYFTDHGIRVIPRKGDVSWEWGLALAGIGRGASLRQVEPATLSPSGNRIDYSRGNLTEWYVNDRRGLEQGFTLDAPTDTNDPQRGLPLYLVLELTGNLAARPAADGQAIDFVTAGGVTVVHYAHLAVRDAAGRQVPAWMETHVGGGIRGIRIAVEDRGASYPLSIDPLATSASWSADGEQSGSKFGCSVATAGDVNDDGYADVVVGAYSYDSGLADAGRAYAYYGSPTGLSLAPDWTLTGIQPGGYFGYSVATAGDVNDDGYSDVIVGEPLYDGVYLDQGRAYVYQGSASGLTLAYWQHSGVVQADAHFGACVATAGDTDADGYSDVIIGAPGYDFTPVTDVGAVQVYLGSGSGLDTTPKWSVFGGQSGMEAGHSVATAGDVNGDGFSDVIFGADKYTSGGLTERGRAYVYFGSVDGPNSFADWWTDGDDAGDRFGWTVGTLGDAEGNGFAEVFVAAPYYDGPSPGDEDRGRVYIFRGSGSGPSATWTFTSHGEQGGSLFGASAAMAGDVNGDGYPELIVGAPSYDDVPGGNDDVGKAYVFPGGPASSFSVEMWSVEGGRASAEFGGSVATAGDVNGDGYAEVVVGAENDGISGEGSAYVYRGSPTGPEADPDTFYWGQYEDQQLGFSVSDAGDINGDGFGDIIFGTPYLDSGEIDQGYAGIALGSENGLTNPASWFVVGDAKGDMLGFDVARAGDVDGDGYDDVAVSAPYTNDGLELDHGAVHVYHGSPSGLSPTPDWTVLGDDTNDLFGYSVAPAGDVNGDGYGDLIVGAVNYSDGQHAEGGAFVYHGSASGLGSSADWVGESNQASAHLGTSVSTAGDVNGDGYSDVVVGAEDFDGVEVRSGAAWVYLGSGVGLRPSPVWGVFGEHGGHSYGHSVSDAGDVNGDGLGDFIVGATRYADPEAEEGKVYVYQGHPSNISTTPSWAFESDQAQAHLGASVSTAGDVNGDGYADIIVGADGYDDSHTDEGRAWVFLGSSSGLAPTAVWTFDCEQDSCRNGAAVTSAGDVNGDGYADVTVGAPEWDYIDVFTSPDRGGVSTFLGNSDGLTLHPRQIRIGGAFPIARLGTSGTEDEFRVSVLARTPFGRAFVKLEWEVEPLGVPFDGAGTETSATWFDTGPFGVNRVESVPDLDEGDPYHWRARLLYHPSTSPFQQRSRWFTVPWSGWDESDLRMACTTAPPVESPEVTVAKTPVTRIMWTSASMSAEHDLVRGDLGILLATAGYFTPAVDSCLANDTTQAWYDDADDPPVGDGYWYLVRAVNCGGAATFDSGGPSQIHGRDVELNAANLSCP